MGRAKSHNVITNRPQSSKQFSISSSSPVNNNSSLREIARNEGLNRLQVTIQYKSRRYHTFGLMLPSADTTLLAWCWYQHWHEKGFWNLSKHISQLLIGKVETFPTKLNPRPQSLEFCSWQEYCAGFFHYSNLRSTIALKYIVLEEGAEENNTWEKIYCKIVVHPNDCQRPLAAPIPYQLTSCTLFLWLR